MSRQPARSQTMSPGYGETRAVLMEAGATRHARERQTEMPVYVIACDPLPLPMDA
jgi:hypothetical protein